MKLATWCVSIVSCAAILHGSSIAGHDWPQWRGPNRDAKATDFKPPATWPKALTQKWKVVVGNGVSTPALVGDKLFVFSLQDGNEVTRCLNALTGKELWQEKYEAKGASGAASQFPGPRSSPSVADGKVVTLGVRGTLSCLDAATGKKVWHKTDFATVLPRFFTSCSPIVVDGLCIIQLGGEREGAIAAYDLASGNERWKWTGDGTAYASPVLFTLDGLQAIVAETAKKIVAIGVADGKLLWEMPFASRGMAYNADTPIVDGQTVIISGVGRGTKAIKIDKQGAELAAKPLWTNPEVGVQFNTPVLKNGMLFGISSRNFLFCINAQTGKTAWTTRLRGPRGYGSIVDAGPVLLVMTADPKLLVIEPTDKQYKQLASYKPSEEEIYAYPIAAGNRLYIKDYDSVMLLTVD